MKKKLLAIIGSPLICCSNSAASSVDVNDEEKMELIGQLQELDTVVVEGEYPLKNYAAMCYTSAIVKDPEPEPEPEPVPVPHVPFPVLKIRKKGKWKYRQIILWNFIWHFSREIHYVALYLESGMESDEILEDKVSLIEQVLGEPLVMKEK